MTRLDWLARQGGGIIGLREAKWRPRIEVAWFCIRRAPQHRFRLVLTALRGDTIRVKCLGAKIIGIEVAERRAAGALE
jgi:hypothetical protein